MGWRVNGKSAHRLCPDADCHWVSILAAVLCALPANVAVFFAQIHSGAKKILQSGISGWYLRAHVE